jgi:hypothetical protein
VRERGSKGNGKVAKGREGERKKEGEGIKQKENREEGRRWRGLTIMDRKTSEAELAASERRCHNTLSRLLCLPLVLTVGPERRREEKRRC